MATSQLEEWTTEANLIRIKHWFRDGLTNEDVAEKKIGINRTTFYRWLQKSSELRKAVEEGKMPANEMVEDAVFKRAVGFYAKEKKIEPDGSITEYEKYYPPDVSAQALYLNNRARNRWKKNWSDETEDAKTIKLMVLKNDLK